MSDTLIHSHFDRTTGLGHIVFGRPEAMNALNQPMADAFRTAVQDITAREGLRAIHISAQGKAFAAGGDISTFADPAKAPDAIDDLLGAINPAVLALARCQVPVVTAVQGAAAGAGFALALVGDFVLASEKAMFAVAYTKLGGSPDGGLTHALARRVGPARALELLMAGSVLSAQEAVELGVASRLLPAEGFDQAALDFTLSLAAGPTLSFGSCKALLAEPMSLSDQLDAEQKGFTTIAQSRDFAEGVSAFVERRTPKFIGR